MENRVLLIGDVVQIGDIKTFPSGAKVLNFTVRTWSRGIEGRVHFEYHTVNVWGEALRRFNESIRTGMIVRIDGTLSHNIWKDQYNKHHERTSVRGLLVKEIFLDVPEITDAEREKFEFEKQKNLFTGNESGERTASE